MTQSNNLTISLNNYDFQFINTLGKGSIGVGIEAIEKTTNTKLVIKKTYCIELYFS